jgi:hypothetical protein
MKEEYGQSYQPLSVYGADLVLQCFLFSFWPQPDPNCFDYLDGHNEHNSLSQSGHGDYTLPCLGILLEGTYFILVWQASTYHMAHNSILICLLIADYLAKSIFALGL